MRKSTKTIFAVVVLIVLLSLMLFTISGCQAKESVKNEKTAATQPEEKSLDTYDEDLSAIDESLDYID